MPWISEPGLKQGNRDLLALVDLGMSTLPDPGANEELFGIDEPLGIYAVLVDGDEPIPSFHL